VLAAGSLSSPAWRAQQSCTLSTGRASAARMHCPWTSSGVHPTTSAPRCQLLSIDRWCRGWSHGPALKPAAIHPTRCSHATAQSVSDVTGSPPCSCRSSILSGSRTSRLYRALVQPGRATSASAVSGYPGEKYPGAAWCGPPACMLSYDRDRNLAVITARHET
jgi:hypothetical protein